MAGALVSSVLGTASTTRAAPLPLQRQSQALAPDGLATRGRAGSQPAEGGAYALPPAALLARPHLAKAAASAAARSSSAARGSSGGVWRRRSAGVLCQAAEPDAAVSAAAGTVGVGVDVGVNGGVERRLRGNGWEEMAGGGGAGGAGGRGGGGGWGEDVLIHPTAVVHSGAALGRGVRIGPFCTVSAQAELGEGCQLHANSHVFGHTILGRRNVLMSGAIVGEDMPGITRLGDDNRVGHFAVVGVRCQDLKYREGDECFLDVGDGNDIREYASIHRSSRSDLRTVVGSRNLIMGACHVAHDCQVGDRNIMANATLLAGHVHVGDSVHTGGATAVHQFCHLGSYCFLAGGSIVTRDVPAFMMVHGDRAQLRGLNLEGMRRAGFSTDEVQRIRSAYRKLFMASEPAGLGLEERLDVLLQDPEHNAPGTAAATMLASIKSSFSENRRGICSFRHWTSTGAD